MKGRDTNIGGISSHEAKQPCWSPHGPQKLAGPVILLPFMKDGIHIYTYVRELTFNLGHHHQLSLAPDIFLRI
jgi:hypothetical protein